MDEITRQHIAEILKRLKTGYENRRVHGWKPGEVTVKVEIPVEAADWLIAHLNHVKR